MNEGDFYGEANDGYIDPKERFCITVGYGIIKYNMTEPFEGFMYDRDTTQWIEIGNDKDNVEECDKIEEVTDTHVTVSFEGGDIRRFKLSDLSKEA